jgi:hypothetical protein
MDICRWLFVYGSSKWSVAVFFLGLICYVEGHGLHLSANAVDRLLGGQEDTALFSDVGWI